MATVGIINGTELGIYVNGTKVAKSTSCDLNITAATRKTTSKDSLGYDEFLASVRGWSISGDFLDAEDSAFNFEDFFDLVTTRAAITVVIKSGTAGDKAYTGSGWITDVKRSAPMEENVTGSYTIMGTSSLTKSTNP